MVENPSDDERPDVSGWDDETLIQSFGRLKPGTATFQACDDELERRAKDGNPQCFEFAYLGLTAIWSCGDMTTDDYMDKIHSLATAVAAKGDPRGVRMLSGALMLKGAALRDQGDAAGSIEAEGQALAVFGRQVERGHDEFTSEYLGLKRVLSEESRFAADVALWAEREVSINPGFEPETTAAIRRWQDEANRSVKH